MSNETVDQYYKSTFIPRAHKIGQFTVVIALVLCMIPALYLSFVLDAFPGIGIITAGFISVAAFAGLLWVIEPVSYFPILGVSGTYMSFLSGNIGNMRVPVAIACQKAINAETGSRRAEVAAVLGISVSVYVNLAFLLVVVLVGQTVIDLLPTGLVTAIKEYTLPALFGAIIVTFISNTAKKYAIIGLLVGLVIFVLPVPGVYASGMAGIVGIIIAIIVARKKQNT